MVSNLISILRNGRVGDIYRVVIPERFRAWMYLRKMARLKRKYAFKKTPSWHASLPASAVSERSTNDDVGVNVVGYLRAEFGLGESARNYGRAIESSGVRVNYFDLDIGLPHSQGDTALAGRMSQSLPYPVSLLFVNPDHIEKAMTAFKPQALGHVIGCWFWELEKLPESWVPALNYVDELMVATTFIEHAVKSATNKNVLRVPLPLPTQVSSGLKRSDFGIRESAFVFLFTFDFASWLDRKNPTAVVRAFKRAFPKSRRDVQLVIKSSNGHRTPAWMQSLIKEIGADKRILFRDETIPKQHLAALQRCADVFVSLHRAEGFGLGLAESMSMGKPVIATGWSGNMDFMDKECAGIVEFDLVPVPEHAYIDGKGQRWAEPREESAAGWMRRLADDRNYARELGEKGKAKVQTYLDPENAVGPLRSHLRNLSTELKKQSSETTDDIWTTP